jgi:ribonuclease P protein component
MTNADEAKPTDAPNGITATCFGISISQKVSKKAVVRNRIKRQIRAVLRQFLPRISPGWLVVIGVRSSACGCNYDEILRELEQLLVEAEVINGHSRRSLL